MLRGGWSRRRRFGMACSVGRPDKPVECDLSGCCIPVASTKKGCDDIAIAVHNYREWNTRGLEGVECA